MSSISDPYISDVPLAENHLVYSLLAKTRVLSSHHPHVQVL